MARSQHNVQALELIITTESGLDRDEKRNEGVEVPIDFLREAVFPAALQSLKLEVVQTSHNLEDNIAPCTRWIWDHVLLGVGGLGGSDLRSIDVWSVQPECQVARERVLRRRWVKSSNDGWQIEE
jgi:hypothetical protein